jgi:metal-responsive CopG/Arc/MetJ family transcriptional regulator
MARQTKIVNMSLPPEIYAQVDEMAKQKGISRSQLLKEALKAYIASERRWQQIRKWGEETAERLGIKDEGDNRILECAVEGKAQYIVTGDRRHFWLYKNIRE